MVSQISLGNFFDVNGRNVLGGIGGSGLDTQTLIDNLTEVRRAPAVELEDQISTNASVSEKLIEFRQLLSSYNSALDALRNPPGVNNASQNAFQFRTANVTASDGTTSSNYVTVSASAGTNVQDYTIDRITQIASAASQSTGTISVADANTDIVDASPGAGVFGVGTVTINGQDVTLEDGDTLNVIASKFNSVSANTGITATVVKIAEGSFQLAFTAVDTGTDANFDLDDIAIDPGGAVFGQVSLSVAEAGQNSQFFLNGINTAIERQGNVIDDVVDGVIFTLAGTFNVADDANTNINVSVQPDTVIAQNSIINFINSYNAIREFNEIQNERESDGTFAETAVLAGNPTFENTINNITSQITSQVAGLGRDNLNSLAGLGITFVTAPATAETPELTNVLTVDDTELANLLNTRFDEVANVFGVNLVSDSSNLKLFSANNEVDVTGFETLIDPATNTFEATYNVVNGAAATAILQDVAGSTTTEVATIDSGDIATAVDSNVITVTVSAEELSRYRNNDTVTIAGLTQELGGIAVGNLNGEREITITGATTFTFVAGSGAEADATTTSAEAATASHVEVTVGLNAQPLGAPTNTEFLVAAGAVATTLGSTTITVTLPPEQISQLNDGDIVNLAKQSRATDSESSIGGINIGDIYNNHKITITSATTFTFEADTTADATATASNDVPIDLTRPDVRTIVDVAVGGVAVLDTSGTITVTASAEDIAALDNGDTVTLAGLADIAGISAANLNGERIITIVDGTSFSFTAGGGETAAGDGVSVNVATATRVDSTGYTITGKSGTAFDGLSLIYGATGTDTITANFSNGLAAIGFNTTEAAIQSRVNIDTIGTIEVELESLQTLELKLLLDITTIDQQVSSYREQLINQFAALEQVISSVNSLLQSLSANDDARIAASG